MTSKGINECMTHLEMAALKVLDLGEASDFVVSDVMGLLRASDHGAHPNALTSMI